MINFLQVGSFFTGNNWYSDIGQVFMQWQQYGVFDYVLPGLLIFALVFGVLSTVQFFRKNRGVDAIIALAVALLSLQFDYVPMFFREIFPRAGVGIAIILVILILTGLFIPWEAKWPVYVMWGVGAIIALVVIALSFSSWTFIGSYWWQQYGSAIVIAVIVLIAVIVVVVSSGKKTHTEHTFAVPMKGLWGNEE